MNLETAVGRKAAQADGKKQEQRERGVSTSRLNGRVVSVFPLCVLLRSSWLFNTRIQADVGTPVRLNLTAYHHSRRIRNLSVISAAIFGSNQ